MKVPTLPKKEFAAKVTEPGVLFNAMPSWWGTILAYALALIFCHYNHEFFKWFPPYLYEVFKNLRGLPTTWADMGLFWAERGLATIAIVTALYHQFWQLGTRYVLTESEIRIESWFPTKGVVSIPLGAIRRYGYRQNWLAFLFNLGTIEIDTASVDAVLLSNCPAPGNFVKLLKPRVETSLQTAKYN